MACNVADLMKYLDLFFAGSMMMRNASVDASGLIWRSRHGICEFSVLIFASDNAAR